MSLLKDIAKGFILLSTKPYYLKAFVKIFWESKSFANAGGWLATFATGKPITKDGSPLPWLTYSAIAFLDQKLNGNLRVLEYGSGNSTLWWAQRSQSVFSVEHDQDWYRLVNANLPENVRLELTSTINNDYEMAPLQNQAGPFDIISIDGLRRVECASIVPKCLSADGVIILDDAHREEYRPAIDHLLSQGFKQIDFYGLQPVANFFKTTTIFYRPQNCLFI